MPIKKEADNNKSYVQTKVDCSFRFMSTSLSSLIDKLSKKKKKNQISMQFYWA